MDKKAKKPSCKLLLAEAQEIHPVIVATSEDLMIQGEPNEQWTLFAVIASCLLEAGHDTKMLLQAVICASELQKIEKKEGETE